MILFSSPRYRQLILKLSWIAQHYSRHTSHIKGQRCWLNAEQNIQTFLSPCTYLGRDLLHKVAFQPHRQYNWHLHLQALDWYTCEFSVGSLSHMSQNRLATPSTQTNHHQLASNNNTNKSPRVHVTEHATIYIYIPQ